MSYSGYGRGKLLLFGEHAAVMGHPALGLALERGIEVALEPDPKAHNWTLVGRGDAEAAMAREVMTRLGDAVDGIPRGGTIRVASTLPEGRGFGSSAALCVALTEAVLKASGSPEAVRHRAIVWAIAHHAEGYFHGSPSGIDTGLATLGGLVAFRPAPPELPEWHRVPLRPLSLLVGSLPRKSNAKALIADIRERSKDPASVEAGRLSRLGALSAAAESLFEIGNAAKQGGLRDRGGIHGGEGPNGEGRPHNDDGGPHGGGDRHRSGGPASPEISYELGLLAKDAQIELSALGLVDPSLATLVETGEATGSEGGKMSGAGGGGAFWLVYPDRAAALRGESALRQKAADLELGEALTLEVLDLRP